MRAAKYLLQSQPATGVPNGITRQDILDALGDLERGIIHAFGKSTDYDVLHDGRRYPPKAVIGLAATKVTGEPFGPKSFRAGAETKCFRILQRNGFTIITKGEQSPFPDEVSKGDQHTEGAVQQVTVNRYERDRKARQRCIAYHGTSCLVCDFDFAKAYGVIGEGFIHVHHTLPLSQIGENYVVDPIKDLRPVCPNCHAMLHKRKHPEPHSIEELRAILRAQRTA